jgi:hypothetical protein
MDAAASENGIKARARWFLGASHMLMIGLLLALMAGQSLLTARFPHSPWDRPLRWADLLFLIWLLLIAWVTFDEERPPLRFSKKARLFLLWFLSLCLAGWLLKPHSAIALRGILFALAALGLGWIRGRRYYVAAAGWFLAGLAGLYFFAWPDRQAESLFNFIGGIGMALQGGWEMSRSLRLRAAGLPQFASTSPPAGTS